MSGPTRGIRAYIKDLPKLDALIKAHRMDTGDNLNTADIIHSFLEILEIPEVKKVWEKVLDERDSTK
jgi:hypothetical protein